uniref:Uncharacterized protein n=1 Tax=Fagus sylvatica TaxID=28930 RepID=A0A2N9GYK8_FAGSY
MKSQSHLHGDSTFSRSHRSPNLISTTLPSHDLTEVTVQPPQLHLLTVSQSLTLTVSHSRSI